MPNDPETMAEKAKNYQAQGNLQEAARFLAEVNEQAPERGSRTNQDHSVKT